MRRGKGGQRGEKSTFGSEGGRSSSMDLNRRGERNSKRVDKYKEERVIDSSCVAVI